MSIAAAVIFHVLTCVRMLQISSGLCKIICSLLRIEDPAFVHSLLQLICSLAEAPTARKVTTSATDTSFEYCNRLQRAAQHMGAYTAWPSNGSKGIWCSQISR